MNKVQRFIEHMKEDNWVFAAGFAEQDYTYSSIVMLEEDCKTLLLEQVYCMTERDIDEDTFLDLWKSVTPEELSKLYKEDHVIHVPGYPFISLFLQITKCWAELQSIVWPGIEKADKEVQSIGEQMIDTLIQLQGVGTIEELHMDT